MLKKIVVSLIVAYVTEKVTERVTKEVKTRIAPLQDRAKYAVHVLKGRPLAYRLKIDGGLLLSPDPPAYIIECQFDNETAGRLRRKLDAKTLELSFLKRKYKKLLGERSD